MCTGFSWEKLKVKDHLKHQGVDGRISSKWTLGRLVGGGGGGGGFRRAQDGVRWHANVNEVFKI
jgi:hypothetical protein